MSGFLAEGVPVTIDESTLREVVEDPVALAAWCRAHPEDPRAVAYLRMLGRRDEAVAAARRGLEDPALPPLVRAVRRARYAQVLDGSVGLEGGWRVYSSGPGVLLRILTQSLLGVRRRGSQVEIDPVPITG